MSIKIRRGRILSRDWPRVFEKSLETTIKVAILLAYPLPVGLAASMFWYFALWQHEWHFSGELEVIDIHAWLPLAGFLYSLWTIEVARSTWSEYKEIRRAIKCYDRVTFMHLIDESVSPLMHSFIVLLGAVILAGFMGLDYQSVLPGMVSTGAVAYFLALITCIIIQIDHPLVGVWFIKYVPEGWMDVDVHEWRAQYHKEMDKRLNEEHPHLFEFEVKIQA